MIKAVDLARLVQTKMGLPYVYSGLGRVYTEADIRAMAKQYPKTYTADYLAKTIKAAGKQGFDCVGLIKFFAWGNEGNTLKFYDANTDMSANSAFLKATHKGEIKTMPEVPGLCVRFDGHIGAYIGGGDVVEARGQAWGVVKTRLSERPWTHWIQFPFGVDYSGAEALPTGTTLKRGDKGQAVKTLQTALNAHGTRPALSVDGEFGPLTETAVKAYQEKTLLGGAFGTVTEKTWEALR